MPADEIQHRAGAGTIDRAEVLFWLGRNAALSALDRPALEELVTHSTVRVLPGRRRLFTAGDPGSAMYLVLSGWVKLARTGPAGRDIVLDLAGPGSLFGELAALCGLPRAADAVALSTARLLSVDGRAVTGALRAQPEAALAVIRLLGERLARTTAQMEDNVFLPAEARLARALLRLAALNPRPEKRGLIVDLGLSQSDLGEITGLARESINKLLGAWRDQGAIALEGRTVIVRDSAVLRGLGEG